MMKELPPDVDYSKLTLAEQRELSWFRSSDGYHTLMISDLAHAKYQELLAKARSSSVPSNRRGFAYD